MIRHLAMKIKIYGDAGLYELLRLKGILKSERNCPQCGKNMSYDKRRCSWRCQKTDKVTKLRCSHELSIRTGTILSQSRVPLLNVFIAMILYVTSNTSAKSIAANAEITRRHLASMTDIVRTLLAGVYLRDLREKKIGGPGKIVEIDETVFNKRKYNRERCIPQRCVNDLKCFRNFTNELMVREIIFL